MKRTQGIPDSAAQKRRQAQEALDQRPLAQIASIADLRALVKAIMDYLQIPYREA